MLTHGRKASTNTATQFWQQFATQQLKELLTAEANVTDFSECTRKKDLIDMCTQNRLDKRVFDRWMERFKENKAAHRRPQTASAPKLKQIADPLQASRHAQQELQSKKRPSLGVDPNTIFDTSESIADEEMSSADFPKSPARRSPASSGDRRVKRSIKKDRPVPRLNIPSRQKALKGAITARREADLRLASLRQSPLKTKRDYETAAAEHCLTASLQMLSELPQRLHVPPKPSATFISDDGNESVTTDLTPLLPQKNRQKTPPTYCDELQQARPPHTFKSHSRDQPVREPLHKSSQQQRDHAISQQQKDPPSGQQSQQSRDHGPRDHASSQQPRDNASSQQQRDQASAFAQVERNHPTPYDRAKPWKRTPTPMSTKTPLVNSRTPAIIKRPSMANSAVRRRALAEAKLVKRPVEDPMSEMEFATAQREARPDVDPDLRTSPSETLLSPHVPNVGSWLWSRVWIGGLLSLMIVWVVCGGVTGLSGWKAISVRSGEPIEFCSTAGGREGKCVPCPVDAECKNGRARCSLYSGLTGALHRWKCVSYKSLVYGIAAKSLPEIATHLRAEDRKRSCQSGDENAHYEDVWDLFDLYVAPYTKEMPESWYLNPSLPSWGLENIEDSRRSDLMTIWYSDVLTETNLAQHKIVKHGTREYALGSFSKGRMWKCRLRRLLAPSFIFSAAVMAALGGLAYRRRKTCLVDTLEKPAAPVSVSVPRRQIRTTKLQH